MTYAPRSTLQIHPTRFVHGLARAVDGAGSSVYEHSRITDISEDGEPPEPMYISAEDPKRSLRHYHGEHGVYLVIVGEGHETGHGQDLSRHYDALVQFAAEHFPVTSIAYRWSAQDYMPSTASPTSDA